MQGWKQEETRCWHALKAASAGPDVLNHMWRSVCGQICLKPIVDSLLRQPVTNCIIKKLKIA